ncbi:aromatic ring-hydroxylating dioxygenase subunit alpha [Synechococcus sp. A15-60]|uniref:aromatic ring-hydroxylating oxygenase subunit alpha n=1 Tax=Synechococcus sp. A15-60 TaxID=1050655 RepID=UPI00185F88B4|nr:rieske [2Fe-2S] domain-containing protein [Synechococcus sp. A15-60]
MLKSPRLNQPFLPGWMYRHEAMHRWDCRVYANRFWHPVAAATALRPGQTLAITLLQQPLLLTWPDNGKPRAFRNRCPHRGVAFQADRETARSCRRLICPYHGWTYNLDGTLQSAARESGFETGFDRQAWGLSELSCRIQGPFIWVALAEEPIPLEQQLALIQTTAAAAWSRAVEACGRTRRSLNCNWKIAHDNTLDDYHVAIAHPTTLHREQGPVRDYVHHFSRYVNLLETPHPDGGPFQTFGLPPWTHVLIWPDGRIALLEFLPEQPLQCTMQLQLLAPTGAVNTVEAEAWLEQLLIFLDEDKALVEAAQRGYDENFQPGPAHQLEQRILHWQSLYSEQLSETGMLKLDRSQEAISALRA